MGITSENVAEKFKITRKQQDYYANISHQRAFKAQKNGIFEEEIIPITVINKDPNTGEEKKKLLLKKMKEYVQQQQKKFFQKFLLILRKKVQLLQEMLHKFPMVLVLCL